MAKTVKEAIRDFVRKVRDAEGEEEARKIAEENLSSMSPEGHPDDKREAVGDQGSHTHIYLGGNEGGPGAGRQRDDVELPGGGGGGADPDIADLAQRVAALEELMEQLVSSEEEDVQLEDPKTQDARMFKLRRGSKIRRVGDELDVPERRPEIMGETDLPGLEDLDERNNRTGDRRRRVTDSADLEENWQQLVTNAEIIVPGFKVGTFDARLAPERTAERMCAARRRVMDKALSDVEIAKLVTEHTGLRTRDEVQSKTLSCDSVKMAFNATAAAIRAKTNGGQVARSVDTGAGAGGGNGAGAGKTPTIAEIQKRHTEYWNRELGQGNGAIRR